MCEASAYIFRAFKAILSIHPLLASEIGTTFPLPKFSEQQLLSLCEESMSLIKNQPSLINVKGPCIVVGDLHGNIMDLVRILLHYGINSPISFIFLGDYVDRGHFSTETLILLLALQNLHPDSFFLLRGNHEFMNVCSTGGFLEELIDVGYSKNLFESFLSLFNFMPLSAIINEKILCVHGGLSPRFHSITQLEQIQKPILFCGDDLIGDILWSDPSDEVETYHPSKRGVGYFFSAQNVHEFLRDNNISAIIRGHECKFCGVENFKDTNLYTVFSASNYCGNFQNHSATIYVDCDSIISTKIFDPISSITREKAKFLTCDDGIPEKLLMPEIIRPVTCLRKGVLPTSSSSRMLILSNSIKDRRLKRPSMSFGLSFSKRRCYMSMTSSAPPSVLTKMTQ